MYEDFDYVSHLVLEAGHRCMIAKVDIQSAFLVPPIHPIDHHLLGFAWDIAF